VSMGMASLISEDRARLVKRTYLGPLDCVNPGIAESIQESYPNLKTLVLSSSCGCRAKQDPGPGNAWMKKSLEKKCTLNGVSSRDDREAPVGHS
jgi:hypothetical protein